MKKELNPAVIIVALVVVLAVAGMFIYRGMTEKPAYPGQNAGHPAAEGEQASTRHIDPQAVNTSEQAAQAGFSGATPGSKPPEDFRR